MQITPKKKNRQGNSESILVPEKRDTSKSCTLSNTNSEIGFNANATDSVHHSNV